MNQRRLRTLVAGVACAAAVSGCGAMRTTIEPTASRATPLSVELSSPGDGGQAGLLAAERDGAMRAAGVAVSLRPQSSATAGLADVESGRVDVAVVPEPELMTARSDGAYVLGFGALVQRPFASLVSLRSARIRSLADLRGRTVAVTGRDYEPGLVRAILADANIPASSVDVISVGSDLAGALTSHRAAAVFGASSVATSLRRSHRAVRVDGLDALQVPTYDGLVFICRETFFANDVNLLRRFVQAVGRGWSQVRADPASGASALQASDPALTGAEASAAVAGALPAAFPAAGRPWGWQDQSQWNALGRWMTSHRLLSGVPAWYLASTNQLLAGQGP